LVAELAIDRDMHVHANYTHIHTLMYMCCC